jgi:hypothetical protein
LPPAKKGYRFNPLRVPKSGVLPDFGIGVCLRQTPSIRRWRIAMETAASMPQASMPFYNFEFLRSKNS